MSYIYQKLDASDFARAFERMGRVDNFEHDGLRALFEYLEELAEDTGEPIELDVIALCCEYSRFESLEEFQEAYGDEYETLEDVRDATAVIVIDDEDGPFIIQNF